MEADDVDDSLYCSTRTLGRRNMDTSQSAIPDDGVLGKGNLIIVRYADDIVVGFEYEADARRFRDAMRARLEEFALTGIGEEAGFFWMP